jgi:hypothetical protein
MILKSLSQKEVSRRECEQRKIGNESGGRPAGGRYATCASAWHRQRTSLNESGSSKRFAASAPKHLYQKYNQALLASR